MTTANTDLTMLGDAFKFVGPMAKTAGVSLEEITAAIQLLSNAGIQGEMAGTTLRGMLLSLTSPSSEAAKELDRLGVKVNDQQGNVRGLANIIGDLESSLAGVGSGEKLRVLGTIFPARQAAGAAELISQGATRLRDATAALGQASGTASKITGTQLNTLQGDFMILLSALEGVGIAIGEALASSLRTAVQGVTGLLSAFGEWVTANKKVILTAAIIVAAVGLLGGSLVGLGIAFQITAFGLAGLAAAMGLAMGLIGAILSPIGLLIVAAIALGTYLVYSSEVGAQALAWLADKFSSLKTEAIQSWDAISAALASGNWALAAKVLWLTLKMEWQRGVNYLTGLWLDAKHAMLNVWMSLKHGMIGVWLSIEKAIFQGINRLILGFQKFQAGLAHTGRNFGEWIYKQSQLAEVAMQEINGTLTADQAEKRRGEIGRNYQAGLHSASNQGQQENQAIDTQFAQQEAQLNADYEAMNRANVSEFAAERNQANQQYAADMARSQSAVDQARREWEAATAAAKNPTPPAADDPSVPNGPPSVSVPAIEAALTSSRSALANEQKQIESKGGFNAFGLGGIAADSFSQRTAKASEEIAVNTKALADQAKRGRLVFTD